ncbi:MAG: tyrosine-type recombinase/integrase [Acidimicrobiales bacterium]
MDGVDSATGVHRPRQLGTYPSKRAAQRAAAEAAVQERTVIERGTVSWLVDAWLVTRTDVSAKTKEQYVWAAGHIKEGLGGIRLDQLDRTDVAAWLDRLAKGGRLARQSIITCRMMLRAVLADAVDEGVLRRSPAARVPMPRQVTKPGLKREVSAWTDEQVDEFLDAIRGHRWVAPLRLAVLYGPRRSELLALRWDDIDGTASTVTIDEGLVKLRGGYVWTQGKCVFAPVGVALDSLSRTLRTS